MSTAPVSAFLNSGAVSTTGELPDVVAMLETQAKVTYPPVTTSGLLLACITCMLALASVKAKDMTRIGENTSKVICRRLNLSVNAQKLSDTFIKIAFLLVGIASISSVIPILVTNVHGSRYRPTYTASSINIIVSPPTDNQTRPSYTDIETTTSHTVELEYTPQNYGAALVISLLLVLVAFLWMIYRCGTIEKKLQSTTVNHRVPNTKLLATQQYGLTSSTVSVRSLP
jgi:hypothetical protein